MDADKNEVLSTGWSLELPDNNPADPGKTHAEQCCFIKISQKYNLAEARLGEVLPKNTVLYTTMEPCNKRLSGNKPCVDRILGLKGSIKAVYIGIKKPENLLIRVYLYWAGRGFKMQGFRSHLWREWKIVFWQSLSQGMKSRVNKEYSQCRYCYKAFKKMM